MVFCNQNGKKWPVKVHFINDSRVYFTKGVLDFWKENNLCLDDKCLLEFGIVRGKVLKEIQVQFL